MSAAAPELVLRAARQGLVLVLVLSAPPLLASLLIGLLTGVLQAATQVQDQSLSFVPKLVVVSGVLVAMGPMLGAELVRFAHALLLAFPALR